jgi:polysaccharide biosynthesis protein PelG
MAGIGIELRRIAKHESIEGILRAYTYAGIISSGPWIISMLSLIVLTILLRPIMAEASLDLFNASVTHAYAFSLILVGPLQLVLTRHASDRFFAKSRESIFPSCYGALALTMGLALAVGGTFFFLLVPGPLLYQISATALLVCVSCIFIVANYLSALRDYKTVVASFAIGYGASGVLAWACAKWLGPESTILGFAAGHAVLFVLLMMSLHREYGQVGKSEGSAWDFLSYFKRFPALMFTGFFYSVGIWADKLMFWWFSDKHQQLVPGGALFVAPQYDAAVYLSFLSIVPGMAVFFLKLETTFAERYQTFFRVIEERGSLHDIQIAKERVIDSLREGLIQLFKVQGVVTVFLVAFARPVAELAGIGSIQTGIFQITLFGAFLLVCFLSMLTILFYFDDQRGALIACMVFAVANAGLSIPTIFLKEAWYGYGFVVAAGVALLIVANRMNRRVERMEEMVFHG